MIVTGGNVTGLLFVNCRRLSSERRCYFSVQYGKRRITRYVYIRIRSDWLRVYVISGFDVEHVFIVLIVIWSCRLCLSLAQGKILQSRKRTVNLTINILLFIRNIDFFFAMLVWLILCHFGIRKNTALHSVWYFLIIAKMSD